MGEIGRFEEEHVPEVAALELKTFHGRLGPASPALCKYFYEIFLANPWRDPDLPSLVYLEDGKVAGFLGVLPRPMLFHGQRVRVAVASQLMADRAQTRAYAGLELIRRFFAGPQDLSLTDGATESAHAVWTAAGGRAARPYALQWTRVLRPMAYARSLAQQHPRFGRAARRITPLLAPAGALFDAAVSRIPTRAFRAPSSAFRSSPANAMELLAAIEAIGWINALKPCYDSDSFGWLLAQAATARRHGELRTAVVRNPRGVVAGWFAYYVKRGGESTVLQFGAAPRAEDEVVEAMLQDAWEHGSAALSGQNMPAAMLALSNRHCVFRYPGNGVLVQSRSRDILACVLEGEAALTRLDGEWWMRFAVENW